MILLFNLLVGGFGLLFCKWFDGVDCSDGGLCR